MLFLFVVVVVGGGGGGGGAMIGIITTGMIVVVAFILMITTMLTTTVIARKECDIINFNNGSNDNAEHGSALEKQLFCSGKSVNTNAYNRSNHKRYS